MYSEDEYEDNGSDLEDFVIDDNEEIEYIGTSDEDEVEEFYEEEEFNENNFEVYTLYDDVNDENEDEKEDEIEDEDEHENDIVVRHNNEDDFVSGEGICCRSRWTEESFNTINDEIDDEDNWEGHWNLN
jgi:hypothetical protein